MKKNKLKQLYFLLGFIFIVFSAMILYNEFTLVTGEKVYLKTVPVDPRDLLRGDYVILSYEIGEDSKVDNLIFENNLTTGDNIYISLNVDQFERGSFKEVSLSKPNNQLYIKGIVRNDGVELGIGKYFVPENRGYEIERLRGDIEVLVSIDEFGSAKILNLYYNETLINFKDEK